MNASDQNQSLPRTPAGSGAERDQPSYLPEFCADDFQIRARGFAAIEGAIAELLSDFQPDQTALLEPEPVDPLAVPKGSCPKCIGPRSELSAACPSCGLNYERFHASQVAPPAELLNVFIRLWATGAGLGDHVRLLTRAQVSGELPEIIRLYRIAAAREPSNLIAREALREAVKLATGVLDGKKEEPESSGGKAMRNIALFVIGNAVLAAVAARTLASF